MNSTTRLPVLVLLAIFFLSPLRTWAADGVETFRAGLKAYQANGVDVLFSTWYNLAEEQDRINELKRRFSAVTRDLGPVVDTEVFAPKSLGRNVQRLYGAIYFRKRPLWIRAEYYQIEGRGGFLSLEFSRNADDILPLEIGVANR